MRARKPVLLSFLPLLWLLNCSTQGPSAVEPDGSSSQSDMAVSMSDPHGPRILSLGTSVNQITEGETARFVAVVIHPDGLDKLAGGQLTSADGTVKYGAFLADRQGSYSLDLTWTLLDQTKRISFASEEQRSFVAEFYDVMGHKTMQMLNLRLHCNGKNACGGFCLAQGDQCHASTDLCISGACKPGCFIAGALTMSGGNSPEPDHGACLTCKPTANDHDWTQAAAGTVCGGNKKCNSGDCGNVFTQQTIRTFRFPIAIWGSSATNVYVLGNDMTTDSQRMVNSTDGGLSWQSVGSVPTGFWKGLWGTGPSTLYIYGESGMIKTTNGGMSWTTVTTGVTSALNQMWGSSSDLWAAGGSGTVLRSTDGGTTWQKLSVPTAFASKDMTAVWGSSASDVYIGTENGYVLRTTNGGSSFTSSKSKSGDSVIGLWGSGRSDVYVVTNSGVSRTTDSGASWSDSTPGATSGYSSVWGSGSADVYVGSNGGLWHSSNNGKNWYRQYVPAGDSISDLWGSDASSVFAISSSVVHFP